MSKKAVRVVNSSVKLKENREEREDLNEDLNEDIKYFRDKLDERYNKD